MNEQDDAGRAGSPKPPSPSPPRRQRAPTITIDTSEVSHPSDTESVPLGNLPNVVHPQGGQAWPAYEEHSPADGVRPTLSLTTSHSFDSKESRPTSPHNFSSPTARGNEHNFLSVPGARSRGNSVDSIDETQASSSYGGDTYLASATTSTEGDRSHLHHNEPGSHSNEVLMQDPDALKPDPGDEEDFQVTDNKFAFSPGQLGKMLNPKSLSAFWALGGLTGLEKGLRSDRQTGLSVDETKLEGTVTLDDARANENHAVPTKAPEPSFLRRTTTTATSGTRATARKSGKEGFDDRRRVFKENRLPEKKAKNIFQLAWIAYNDKVLILLTIAAVVSLALGLYQTFQPHDNGMPRVEWVEGVAIMVAIIIVVVVGAVNDYQKERQFIKLNKKKEDRIVKVIRSGKSRQISIYDVLVGDVMHLEPGDLIPVDGILIAGHNVRCDESSATGESDIIKKQGAEEVMKTIEANEDPRKLDPFIISGAKMTEGIGTFMVTAVGVNSSYGKTMMSLRDETEATPLQLKLNVLAEQIAKLGGAAALLLFVVLFIKFLVGLRHNIDTPSQKGQNFLQIVIVAITIVVVAVPEGLPLAVTLALAFATTKMLKDNNLVRLLRACETMGNATTICSDKTGTLTQNKMSVVAGTIGTASRFGDKRSSSVANADPTKGKTTIPSGPEDVSAGECVDNLATDVKEVMEQSIVVNTTAFEGEDDGVETFIGSKTETALLSFARDHLGMGPVSVERSNAVIAQMVPFDSGRKCMAAVVKLPSGIFRMYVKGASEILLGKCTRIIRDPTDGISDTRMSKDNMESLTNIIDNYASRSLRTLSLIFRDFEQWPPKGCRKVEDDPTLAVFDDAFKDMVFLAIVGIQDPLRDGVKEAVRTCQNAGVFVRMVTGDNMLTARAIAEECGIYTPGGIVMEGPKFRKLTDQQRSQTVPRLQVLARSSPGDKRMLVDHLKSFGETVAVTGDGTNDAPALKIADVGFSMGIAGTEVAKEASDIILMDDNFSSIVKALMWGRAVNDSVKKFLQFQVTVNITAVLLTFVSAVARDDESSVLTAVQLLWVNLIMDTFAALALATDPPTLSVLDRKPDPKSAPLITVTMWKMIIGQAIYQLVVTFILNFGGSKILSYSTDRELKQLNTLIFNTFVWMQIFNQLNNRRLDNRLNIFEGITKNYFFIAINVIMIGGQTLIIFVGGAAFTVTPLNGAQWGYSIVLGALSIPIGIIIRLVPDELIAKIIPDRYQRRKAPQVVVSGDEDFDWNPLVDIRDELAFLKKLRGGRLNAIKFKLQHPVESLLPGSGQSRSRSNSLPQTPLGDNNGSDYGGSSLPATPDSRSRHRHRSRSNSAFGPAAAMAGIVAGSVAGWSPIDRHHGENDSIRFSRSTGRVDIENEEGIEVHPNTKAEDPVVSQHPTIPGGLPPSQRENERPAPSEAQRQSSEQHKSLDH
ncbi:MAG: hypothetical protein M4579_003921 [Chaenotheca gracillima]|nr:MAG: hypothetical protein M4579_003921 [Chaenotheca gracillima]